LARLTRQKLKQDEFATRIAAFQEFFLQNQRQIAMVTAAVVLAAGVVLGGYSYMRSRETRAGNAFALALAAFHAPVMEAPPPNAPNSPHFKTASEKYQEAYKQFTDIAGRYSWFSQGKLARYYAALCQRDLGKSQEAEKDLNAIAAGRDQELAALAKMALAGVYQQTGRNDQAEKLYQELQNHPTNTVPKATAQLALADLYQKTKPAEATALYKKIQTEYAGSAVGDAATRMLQAQSQSR
jgi:tetratricopeptide (TPR) repeat protein